MRVLTQNGIQKATVFASGVKETLIITTIDGRRIELTGNHPVLTDDQQWTKAEDLEIGDKIVLGKQSLKTSPNVFKKQAYALGHFLGDGWFVDSGMGFASNEQSLIDTLIPIWDTILEDAEEYIETAYDNRYQQEINTYVDKNGVINVGISKPHVKRYIKELGFIEGRAATKRLPSYYWQSDTITKQSFLRGLYDAEGSIVTSPRRSVSFTSASEELARDLLLALNEFGIIARMTTHYVEVRGRYQTIVQIRGKDNIDRFKETIFAPHNDLPSRKVDQLQSMIWEHGTTGETTATIKRIDRGEPQVVYDMTVENDHHFIAEGLIVHNCNLAEVIPTRCKNESEYFEAIYLATIYASSVALLLTDDDETNAIIERNRRIGVSITGIADWMATIPRKSDIVRLLNKGYDLVKATNVQLAIEAKVPQSIRLTTVKPSGTVSLLAGVSAGMHHPLFQTYVRRMKVGNTSPIYPILVSAGVPYEADLKEQDTTTIFEFPIHQKNIRPQDQVSLAEHGLRLILLSRFWADNAVSNTSTYRQTRYDDVEGNEYSFDPDMLVKKQGQWYAKKFDNGVQSLVSIDKIAKGEEEDIEPWLTYVLPHVKSISMLGYMNGTTVYKQAPYEGITMDEFDKRSAAIGDVDWSTFEGSDGEDSRYCEGEYCAI